MIGVYGWFKSGSCEVPDGAFRPAKVPDGGCTAAWPADPVPDAAVLSGPFGATGGRRFVARRWLEKVTFALEWADVDPKDVKGWDADQIAAPFRDRELKRLGAKSVAESRVQFIVGDGRRFDGLEATAKAGEDTTVLRFLIEPDAKRPRLYVLAVTGTKIKADHPAVRRFFNGFAPE